MTFSSLLRTFVYNKSIKHYILRPIINYSKSSSELYFFTDEKKILKLLILFYLIPSHLISKTIVSITNRELK